MTERSRRAELESLQAELARLRGSSLDDAAAKLIAELELERRRLARLRAELTQLGPRVEHLRRRVSAKREPVESPTSPIEVVQLPRREVVSEARKQRQASVNFATAVLIVVLSFFGCCVLFMSLR